MCQYGFGFAIILSTGKINFKYLPLHRAIAIKKMEVAMKKSFARVPLFFIILFWLIILLIPSKTVILAQEVDYSEDFEDGEAQGWELSEGWQIIEDGGNQVLAGAGHFWAYSYRDYDNCRLSFRIKVLAGDVHLVYRLSSIGRYFIRFNSSGSWLSKQYFPNDFQHDLAGKSIPHKNNSWHQVEISGQGDTLTISVDGKKNGPLPIPNHLNLAVLLLNHWKAGRFRLMM